MSATALAVSDPRDHEREDFNKLVYPGDWLWFRDRADFDAFWQGEYVMPECCVGLESSEAADEILAHDPIKVDLSCNCKLAEQPDGFYFHRTRHFAHCSDCQQAEWFAQGFEVFNGFPYGDWRATPEQRRAGSSRNELEKAERWLAQRLEAPKRKAWLASPEGQQRQKEHKLWVDTRLAECNKVLGDADERLRAVAPISIPKGLQQLSSVAMLPIQFVDKPLFQANAFHLVVGKKNAGKGTFLSSVAARFTRGELGESRNVIWIAAGEDSMSLDVRPRIEAAGGDTGRVCFPSLVPRLPEAVVHLRGWIQGIGGIGLIVLDPISGMLRAGTNTNMDSDVRSTIAPLNDLADEAKCLIIGVRHLRKDASQGALDSVLGAVDWANVPRAVLAIAIDNEDESIRHVQVVAGNRIPRGTASRSFRIVGAHVVKGGEPVAKAEFIDGTGKDVDDMLQAEPNRNNSKTKLAKIAMLDKLEAADSGLESDTLTAAIASELGISVGTVRNAKTWLKDNGLIKFFPDKDEDGKIVQWNVKRTNAPRPEGLQDQFTSAIDI